ncbi:hypothetical protein WDU94_001043 [Cyamophila willieti]
MLARISGRRMTSHVFSNDISNFKMIFLGNYGFLRQKIKYGSHNFQSSIQPAQNPKGRN